METTNINSLKIYIAAAAVAVISFVGIMEWVQISQAITQTQVGASFLTIRRRITAADILEGTSVNGIEGYRRVVIGTLPPANALLLTVTRVTTPLTISDAPNANIYADKFVAENSLGEQVSSGNIARPPTLSRAYLENGLGDSLEYSLFSESASTDIVMYIRADRDFGGYANLNNLDGGQFDVYLAIGRP